MEVAEGGLEPLREFDISGARCETAGREGVEVDGEALAKGTLRRRDLASQRAKHARKKVVLYRR